MHGLFVCVFVCEDALTKCVCAFGILAPTPRPHMSCAAPYARPCRAAMVGVAGIIANELIRGAPVF